MKRWLMTMMIIAVPAMAAGEPPHADVVAAVADHMEADYVFAETGAEVADELRARLRRGEYNRYADAASLAEKITRDLQELAGVGHLMLEYSATPLSDDPDNSEFNEAQNERYYGAHLNFGFRKVEILEPNIGLLELGVFAPVEMGGDTAVAAMHFLAHTQALVIDLRANGGGHPEMVNLLAAYLLPPGSHQLSGYYSRSDDTLTQNPVQSYVPGPRYGENKALFILVSEKTFSAAENFAYDLQALGRATIVGEPSGGGAHPFEYTRISPHFVLWLEKGRSLNPITGSNWQGIGVKPDVQVRAEDALEKAVQLAKESLIR